MLEKHSCKMTNVLYRVYIRRRMWPRKPDTLPPGPRGWAKGFPREGSGEGALKWEKLETIVQRRVSQHVRYG